MVRLFRQKRTNKKIIPQKILSWKNSHISVEQILHYYSRVKSGSGIFKYDYWFREIFLNGLKNLVPFLEIYPVEYMNGTINRKKALRNGLNEFELEGINANNYSVNFLHPKSKGKCIKIWEVDFDNYFLLGIEFDHPPQYNDLSSHYELGFIKDTRNLTIQKSYFPKLLDVIKNIYEVSYPRENV